MGRSRATGGRQQHSGQPKSRGAPNYDVNEYWRQLTNIDTEEFKKDQAVGRRSEFLEEQKLDEPLTHYWQVAEAGSEEYIIVGDILYRALDAKIHSLHDKALMAPENTDNKYCTWLTIICFWHIVRSNRLQIGSLPISSGRGQPKV